MIAYKEYTKQMRENSIAVNGILQVAEELWLQIADIIDDLAEKQIPKKPIYVDTRFRNHGRHISDGCSLDKCYKCPNCGDHIFHIWDSEIYCPRCGQALDWEQKE